MANSIPDWQALGFAVDVNPDGLRQMEFLPATEDQPEVRAGDESSRLAVPPAIPAPAADVPLVPPSLLRMAASVTKAMVKFAASGFRIVDAETHQVRVAQCQGCQYRNDSRCQVCGCFFDKKAWLPHEDCPLGKWPA